MSKHFNLKAYQNHEAYSDYPDDQSVIIYFKEKLNTCDVLVEFIRSNVINDDWNGNVAEIGSGTAGSLIQEIHVGHNA